MKSSPAKIPLLFIAGVGFLALLPISPLGARLISRQLVAL
jgi:hypothetical protein